MMQYLVIGLIFATSTVMAEPTLLLETPVKITVEAKLKTDAPPTSALNLAINQGSHEFRLTVLQRGSVAEALAAQKARTGWKDGYLFIRDDCLGTRDDKRKWRCVVDQVFTFVDSREGKRLVHLGEIAAGDDCIEELKVGCALFQGTFTDIYDALENNALVSRAEAPELLVEMHVVSGEFVVDLDETWGRNQERFSAGIRCLSAKAAERPAICSDGITPRSAYLFNSTLATYTKRVEQLTSIRTFARSAICGNDKRSDDRRERKTDSDCSELLRLSALMQAGIRPGEKPRSRGNVQSIPLPANK